MKPESQFKIIINKIWIVKHAQQQTDIQKHRKTDRQKAKMQMT